MCVGAWSGGVVWSHPFCLRNTSCAMWVCMGAPFPPPFSPAAQWYKWGRVTFLSLSLSPNCYWEGWVNSFLISFHIVLTSQIKAPSLPLFALQRVCFLLHWLWSQAVFFQKSVFSWRVKSSCGEMRALLNRKLQELEPQEGQVALTCPHARNTINL